jgi:hypothetical protein
MELAVRKDWNENVKMSTKLKVLTLHGGLANHEWTICEIPRDDLFSDDFGFKINALVTNFAHILFSEDH